MVGFQVIVAAPTVHQVCKLSFSAMSWCQTLSSSCNDLFLYCVGVSISILWSHTPNMTEVSYIPQIRLKEIWVMIIAYVHVYACTYMHVYIRNIDIAPTSASLLGI